MHIKTRLYRASWWLRDNILFRYRRGISFTIAAAAFLSFRLNRSSTYYKLIMKLDRLGENFLTRYIVSSEVQNFINYSLKEVQHNTQYAEDYTKRTLVLKDPVEDNDGNIIEKGVFLIKFTPTFRYVFHDLDIRELQRFFHVILEPSWAGYCLPEILAWCSAPQAVIVQSSDEADRRLLNKIDRNLLPVSFGSSDWVDPSIFFRKDNVDKEYDAISISNFNSIKRPYRFIKALKRLRAQGHNLKAALVCARWGENRAEIIDYINSSKLSNHIDLYESLSQPELNDLLNKSKVNLLLSFKEGSNRSIFEGFFADVPGVVLLENVGVNKNYFNDKTGKCIPDRSLETTLLHFSENWKTYSPRAWAMDNISPNQTTKKLAKIVASLERKTELLQPILEKANVPEAKLTDAKSSTRWDAKRVAKHFKRENH